MQRRQFLAAAGGALTVALAGCSRPPRVDLRLVALPDADIGEQLVRPARDLSPEGQTVVRRAHENGSYVRTSTDWNGPYVHDGRVVSFEDRVFAVRTTRVGVERRTLDTFDVTYTGRGDNTTVEVDSDARIVDHGDLPAIDREMFDSADPGSLARDGSAMSAFVRDDYPDDADSVFVPEQEYDAVRYDGHTFLVEYQGPRTVENGRFRYELEPLAPDVATYVERVVDEHVFTLARNDLSEEQRGMVDTAIEEGYSEEKELSEAFAALVERISAHEPVDRSHSNRWYVLRYDGTTYYATVDDNDRPDRTTDRPYRTTDEEDDETGEGTATTTAR
ncbi:hypothetical protein [Haloarchaeobius iranensis]|uniref:Uncharacterized protein n=1 Tax=Haloarchaeobius iranensis TaxID=996166 RepID=A0A1G9SJV8_9EURY|nr:hypothetical protein [Haloarchaeobius iranensis]SDM35776.1 hypothetical protein SAMN05192554_101230 [Haloarchaeobius iranensis]